MIQREGDFWVMAGLASAHSHAFQRVLRGRTQRKSTDAKSFWSWRGLMYALAEKLSPDQMYDIARLAYAELAMSGVTMIGEFHYLHHDLDGSPYSNRTETSEQMIQAAKDVGIRICLIRTAYMRGGYQQELESAQQRFSDSNVDDIIHDVDNLRKKFADDDMVTIGLAAHSIRAVPIAEIRELSAYADEHNLPFHMHICEQRRELEESRAEYGTTPVNLLAENGILSPRFVGVHATHLQPEEIKLLGDNQTFACLCRTTERDLGDGLPQISDLIQAGARLCVGVDSHASPDAFEEIRAVENDERSRLEARNTIASAPFFVSAATTEGYASLGYKDISDKIYLSADDPSLLGISEELASDAIIYGATPRAVSAVIVNEKRIVENGVHVDYPEIKNHYHKTLKNLDI